MFCLSGPFRPYDFTVLHAVLTLLRLRIIVRSVTDSNPLGLQPWCKQAAHLTDCFGWDGDDGSGWVQLGYPQALNQPPNLL